MAREAWMKLPKSSRFEDVLVDGLLDIAGAGSSRRPGTSLASPAISYAEVAERSNGMNGGTQATAPHSTSDVIQLPPARELPRPEQPFDLVAFQHAATGLIQSLSSFDESHGCSFVTARPLKRVGWITLRHWANWP